VFEQQPLTASAMQPTVGEHTASMRARLQSSQLGAAEETDKLLDAATASSGFTASDLSLPLQCVLLHEEHLRHARALRPPVVALNLNSLSAVTSLALGLRQATPGWGSGQVLRHANPIPRTQMGEDLGDGFAFHPPRSAVHMDSIHFAEDPAAAQSQASLLAEYKQLHKLQQEEGLLRTKHSNANFEHGDAARVVAARKTAAQRERKHGQQLAPLQTTATAASTPAAAAAGIPSALVTAPLSPVSEAASSRTTASTTAAVAATAAGGSPTPSVSFSVAATPGPTAASTGPTFHPPAPLVISSPSAAGGPPTGVATATAALPPSTTTTKRRAPPSSLHKVSKLSVLQSEASRAGGAPSWSAQGAGGGLDDPTLFLTPRTKEILKQVEGNREKHEAERAERDRKTREALERAH